MGEKLRSRKCHIAKINQTSSQAFCFCSFCSVVVILALVQILKIKKNLECHECAWRKLLETFIIIMCFKRDIRIPLLKVFLISSCFPRHFVWMQYRTGGSSMMSTVFMDIPCPYQHGSKKCILKSLQKGFQNSICPAFPKTARDFTSTGTQFLENTVLYLNQCS